MPNDDRPGSRQSLHSCAILTATPFGTLAEIPPALERFANLTRANTRRAYRQDIIEFQAFAGLGQPEVFRDIARTQVIAWREDLTHQTLAQDTICHKSVARSSLYAYCCETHAVGHNPVLGFKRQCSINREGVTPALGDHQAQMLLEAPFAETPKGTRDCGILATLLYHLLRCEELCTLTVGDFQPREGVPHLRVEGREDQVRDLPLHVLAQPLITAYLEASWHAVELHCSLFRPVQNNTPGPSPSPCIPRPCITTS